MSERSKLRLALYCTGCIPGYQLPCFAGAAQQIFGRHGLTVEIIDPVPGPDNVLAAAAGRHELCLTSVAHFLNAKRQQPDLDARFVFMLARQTHMTAFVVEDRPARHGRPITAHSDLAGASVLGEPDSAFVREYSTCLRWLGIRPGAVVPTPYEATEHELLTGRGDVAADFLDLLPRFQAVADGPGLRIRALPFYAAGIDIYGSGLVAGRRLLEDDPGILRAVLEAFHAAVLVSRADPEAGLAELIEHIPTADPALAIAGWNAGSQLVFDKDSPLGAMSEEKWRRTIEFHADAYGSSSHVNPSEVYEDVDFDRVTRGIDATPAGAPMT